MIDRIKIEEGVMDATLNNLKARNEVNRLNQIENRTEEQNNQLANETLKVEDTTKEMEKLIADWKTQSIEQRSENQSNPKSKLEELIAKSNVGRIFDTVISQRELDGAERELQTELGLASNQIPLQLLNTRSLKRIDTRAVTPGLDDVSITPDPVLPVVFPNSASAFLGVSQPQVAAGERTYPVLTTGATASTPAEGASVAESTGAFSANEVSPSRIQASFFFSRESAAVFEGMQNALVDNLNSALSDKLDAQVITGLIAGGTAADHTSTAPATYDTIHSILTNSIDGRHAETFGDLRLLLSPSVFQFASTLKESANGMTAIDNIQARTGGYRVNPHIPAIASKKGKSIVRLGGSEAAVSPIWSGISLITDEVTKAATGEIVITAIMLYGFAVTRKAFFRIPEIQNAS